MTGTNLVFDSSAWVEYFRASKIGEKVWKLIDTGGNTILTTNIAAAEVISIMKRLGYDYQSAAIGIRALSIPAKETQEDYLKAGERHIEMKEKFGDVSLADTIIAVIAEKNNARIVTKDFHLKSSNSIFLE